ncbi:hypothetical protein BWQ96_04525 [Gracilariopsis chorda]|uniref:Pherophorin domain-containing protein n=1 Tax=Gracilariopsis chorda TaxID=448386 RepID=A0A2V3IVM1_9FLOR|nr:hypothetical protein BWQ96_04525 [Gracilariopsis chorda]|eukprot:PXF45757.1 hypothetical protein BWQ96_04525 [Gracilariopsis chorda]
MKIISIAVLALLSLAPSATLSFPITLPHPSPSSIPAESLFDAPFPSEEPTLPAPCDAAPFDAQPLSTPLSTSFIAEQPFPVFISITESPSVDLPPFEYPPSPTSSDAALFDEQPLATESPDFQIITCTFNGCTAFERRHFECINSQGSIRPDLTSAVLLLSEVDERLGSRITYSASVPSTSVLSGDPISPVPWVSTLGDAQQTSCVQIETPDVSGVSFIAVGSPFGSCCGACSFLNRALSRRLPPPLSCCRSCNRASVDNL